MAGRLPCARCKTAGGVALCDGCQSTYCMPHFVAHRQELFVELDNIGQNYDLLRRDITEATEQHPVLIRINTWEEEAINKIRKAAEIARIEVRNVLHETKNSLQSSVTQISEEIRASRDAEDFTENDFRRWTIQLDDLRQEFEFPYNITVENIDQEETSINLIKISDRQQQQHPSLLPPAYSLTPIVENHFRPTENQNIFTNEKFDPKTDAAISDDYRTATCLPKFRSPGAIVYGVNNYSNGVHDISFRIIKKGLSRLFFGIYSSVKPRVETISSGYENSVYGWWDIDSGVLNGTRLESGLEHIISIDDKIVLTLDCEQRQIQLYHIRENRVVIIPVDINKCPFPWKLVMKLTSNGDCVRLL